MITWKRAAPLTPISKSGHQGGGSQEVLDEKISTKQNDAWTTAVTEFLKSSDWPGETERTDYEVQLAELNLVDRLSILGEAYNAMRS